MSTTRFRSVIGMIVLALLLAVTGCENIDLDSLLTPVPPTETQPTDGPNTPPETPGEPGDGPAEPGDGPAEPGDGPAEPGDGPVEPGDGGDEPVVSARALLPAPLYFIGSADGQVRRLERDGATVTTVTDEPQRVDDFDVATGHNWLVYTSGGELIQIDLTDGARTVKVAADDLPTEPGPTGQPIVPRAPRIAPDGSQIAFILGGVQLMPTGNATGMTLVLPDDPAPDFTDPTYVFPDGPIRFMQSAEWSPDGTRLAVTFGYFPEAGGLGLLTPADGTFVDLSISGGGSVGCCEFSWAPDSSGGFITSEIFVYGTPGLSRVDAAAGTVTDLFVDDGSDEFFDAFRSGHVQADGTLVTFRAEMASAATYPYAYVMTAVSADGTTTTPLRPSIYFLGPEILWADDGSGAVIANQRFDSGFEELGTVRWLSATDAAVLELPVSGRAWRWGSAPQPVPAYDATALQALRDQATADFGVTLGTDVDDVAVRPLVDGSAPLFVAHTVGFHSFDPLVPHHVAVYRDVAGAWELLAQTALTYSDPGSDTPIPGPDYLFEQSVSQAFVNGSDLWLLVEGGIGAHGGLMMVLRYDGSALTVAAANANGSPAAGFVQDLNGDGLQEVILDVSDPYVFAYASGVRLIDYRVQRWVGTRLFDVALTPLPAGAPEPLRSANNRLVELAQADLWQDAMMVLRTGLDDEGNQTVRWNKALVNLIGSARERTGFNSAYPIMTLMFYGDYPGATFYEFDGLSPAQIFDPAGPLIAGTPADGWLEPMAATIQDFTTRAIAAKPDEAGAYFLRGWAAYLLDPGNAAAIADVVRAAEVNPNNVIYPPAAAYLTGP